MKKHILFILAVFLVPLLLIGCTAKPIANLNTNPVAGQSSGEKETNESDVLLCDRLKAGNYIATVNGEKKSVSYDEDNGTLTLCILPSLSSFIPSIVIDKSSTDDFVEICGLRFAFNENEDLVYSGFSDEKTADQFGISEYVDFSEGTVFEFQK